jgi:hypothetical protein
MKIMRTIKFSINHIDDSIYLNYNALFLDLEVAQKRLIRYCYQRIYAKKETNKEYFQNILNNRKSLHVYAIE